MINNIFILISILFCISCSNNNVHGCPPPVEPSPMASCNEGINFSLHKEKEEYFLIAGQNLTDFLKEQELQRLPYQTRVSDSKLQVIEEDEAMFQDLLPSSVELILRSLRWSPELYLNLLEEADRSYLEDLYENSDIPDKLKNGIEVNSKYCNLTRSIQYCM